ncbi:MAG: hypothetical protein ABSA58_04465 [Acetobacteraceae bacterium]|jgi:hypothetical protein
MVGVEASVFHDKVLDLIDGCLSSSKAPSNQSTKLASIGFMLKKHHLIKGRRVGEA